MPVHVGGQGLDEAGATRLGNPVDLAFDGTNLFIAEKSNSAILRYDAILDFTGVDMSAPSGRTHEPSRAPHARARAFHGTPKFFARA